MVLHIDLEFISAIICKSNGSYIRIENGNEELLWLYFFNDPYQNRITYGKENRNHFHKLEDNYYGNFINQVVDNNAKFTRNGIQRPLIELLEISGLLNLFINRYNELTPDASDQPIPTLITFSASLKEESKQKLVEYLTSRNFFIESGTIPLPELVSYYFWKEDRITANKGKVILFLEATNSTLHIMKLSFIEGYFFKDHKTTETYSGRGYDPRKKAIINFVVNDANKSTGLLQKNEIEKECERFESSADEWLKRLDAAGKNVPVNIKDIRLTPAMSIWRDVLVRKNHIEQDTGYYLNELTNIYSSFEDKEVKDKSTICAVILLGECFNNTLIKDRFTSLLKEKLLIIPVNRLNEILTVFPEIDFKKYSDDEVRLEILRKDEEETRIMEDDLRKKEEEERKKQEEKEEQLRNIKIAGELYDKAKLLYKDGKLSEAISKVEKAKSLHPTNSEISSFFEVLMKEKTKVEQFNGYLKDAEENLAEGELNKALSKFKLAQKIYDNERIRESIDTIYSKIEDLRVKKEAESIKIKIHEHLIQVDSFVSQKKFQEALNILHNASTLDGNDPDILRKRAEIDVLIELQTTRFNHILGEAKSYLNEGQFDEAEKSFREALKIKPGDEHCLKQLAGIAEERKNLDDKIIAFKYAKEKASESFARGDWDEAERFFREALRIKPGEQICLAQLKNIEEARKKLENKKIEEQRLLADRQREYNSLTEQASDHFARGEFDEAERIFKKALIIKPDDQACIAQLKTIAEVRKREEEKRIAEQNLQTMKEQEYQTDIEQATEHFTSGEWDYAEKLYRKALIIKPEDKFCLAQLRNITFERKRIEDKNIADEQRRLEEKKIEAERKRLEEKRLEDERKSTLKSRKEKKDKKPVEPHGTGAPKEGILSTKVVIALAVFSFIVIIAIGYSFLSKGAKENPQIAEPASPAQQLPGKPEAIKGLTTVVPGQRSVTYTVPVIANATAYLWSLPAGSTGSGNTNSIIVNFYANAVSGDISVRGKNSAGEGPSSSLAICVRQAGKEQPNTPPPTPTGVLPGKPEAINGAATVT